MFGGIRQVGAHDDFELATAGPVLQDYWSLVLCTHYGVSMAFTVPLRLLAARTLPDAFDLQTLSLFGEGSKAGHVPSDIEQATGLERLQLLGQLHRVDVFNTGPSTLPNPALSRSLLWSLLTSVLASEKVIGALLNF